MRYLRSQGLLQKAGFWTTIPTCFHWLARWSESPSASGAAVRSSGFTISGRRREQNEYPIPDYSGLGVLPWESYRCNILTPRCVFVTRGFQPREEGPEAGTRWRQNEALQFPLNASQKLDIRDLQAPSNFGLNVARELEARQCLAGLARINREVIGAACNSYFESTGAQIAMSHLFQVIRHWDLGIYQFLGRYAGNWFVDRLVSHEESNSLFKGGLFIAAYWYLWFQDHSDPDRRRRLIITIVTAALAALALARALAFAIPFQVRPAFDQGIRQFSYSFPISRNMENWNSFPSDTATYFFALAFGLAYLLRRFVIPILLFTAVWICLPRLYLGEHYASDIVVGAAIGIAAVWIALRIDWIQSTFARRVLQCVEKSPQWFYGIAFLVSFEMAVLFDDVRNIGRGVFQTARHVPIHWHSPSHVAWTALVLAAVSASCLAIVLYRRHVIYRHRRPVLRNGHL